MSYFTGTKRPFQLRDGFRFRRPCYVISYWETVIDHAHLRNESFKTKRCMDRRIRQIKNSDMGTIYSALQWRFMKG